MAKQTYFNTPIELYQHFIENTRQCTDNVFDYCIAAYDTKSEAEAGLHLASIGDWAKSKENGTKLRQDRYNGTQFSIPIDILFDYYKNHNTKTNRQKTMLLGYLALKSIAGWKKITVLTNGAMFARMAGYPSAKLLPSPSELGAITEYNNPYKLARVRADITDHFNTVHIYSQKGKRGFAVMFSDIGKQEALTALALYMETRTQKYKDKKRRELAEEARHKAVQQTMTKKEKQKAYVKSLNLNR